MRNFMTKNSVFYLRKENWDDIEDYEEGFKQVIKQRECNRIPFSHQSPQISYRKLLIDHIKQMCIKKKLSQSCLHLAVYIMDIFMDNHAIIFDKLLLTANVCLLLAAKFEESTTDTPKIVELNLAVGDRYTRNDYKTLEMLIWAFFHFHIMFPTPAHYIYYFIQGIICCKDLDDGRSPSSLLCDLHTCIMLYLDKIIDDVHYMQCYAPSKLAAAIIAISRVKVGLSKWTLRLQKLTDYDIDTLEEPMQALLKDEILQCQYCTF